MCEKCLIGVYFTLNERKKMSNSQGHLHIMHTHKQARAPPTTSRAAHTGLILMFLVLLLFFWRGDILTLRYDTGHIIKSLGFFFLCSQVSAGD